MLTAIYTHIQKPIRKSSKSIDHLLSARMKTLCTTLSSCQNWSRDYFWWRKLTRSLTMAKKKNRPTGFHRNFRHQQVQPAGWLALHPESSFFSTVVQEILKVSKSHMLQAMVVNMQLLELVFVQIPPQREVWLVDNTTWPTIKGDFHNLFNSFSSTEIVNITINICEEGLSNASSLFISIMSTNNSDIAERIATARHEAETLKEKIKQKKDALADTTRK